MHYKKSKLHKLHSIPIGLCNSNKYLVSYSIPLSCMVVLLLGGIVAINPSLPLKTNAVTIQDEWVVKENDSDSSSDDISSTINNVVDENDTDKSSDSVDSSNTTLSDADAGISPMSIINGPSLTISLGKTSVDTSTVQGGNTAYASNTVTLTGSYVKDYTLSLKAASSNLTMPSGASSSTSTISGVGSGTLGSNMGANKWGYVVTETSNTNYAELTYKTVPTSNDTIASGAGNTESSSSMNVSKQLVFAAKFGSDVTPGKYSASITLSATATPKALTMANITEMQDMTPAICANSSTGQTATLKDNRDTNSSTNSYTIVKLEDERCWMQQNLRLTGNRTLTPSDSNVSSNWSMPASLTSLSSTNFSDFYKAETYYKSDTLSTDGVYYSFTAATAGAATSSVTSGEVGGTNGNSVCPKGWMLPTNSEYSNMLTKAGIGNNSAGSTKIRGDKYKFPYAGYVNHGPLNVVGSKGRYWSRTVNNSNYAYNLCFDSSNVYMNDDYRLNGRSVRCVASN